MKARASRTRLLTFGLTGTCVVLAVLAFVPPRLAGEPETDGPAPVAAFGDDSVPKPARPAVAPHGPAFQRPIFVPARRMPSGRGTGSVGRLTLKAVFLGPGVQKALLLGARGPEGIWVTPGQTIDGWRVEEIRTESVILAGPDRRRELSLEKPEAAPAGKARRQTDTQRRNAQQKQESQ